MFKLLLKYFLIISVMLFGLTALADNHKEAKKDKAKASEVKQDKSSGWKFKGQGVLWFQTSDGWGNGSWFDQGPAAADEGFTIGASGVQLFAENKNLIGGLGAGVELTGLSSLGLEEDVVFKMRQNAGGLNSAGITQAYLTYKINNTKFKWGRQNFGRDLNPFSYSEPQFLFKNSFEALTITNTDIEDTTVIFSNIAKQNIVTGDLSTFVDYYSARDALNRLTVRNKSFDGVTFTGHYYWMPDFVNVGGDYISDADALWFDVKFKVDKVNVALQAGYIGGVSDAIAGQNIGPYTARNADDTTAYGAMVSGKVDKYNWKVAFSSIGDGALNIANNFGSGFKSPMFTLGGPNHNAVKRDSDTVRVTVAQPLGKGNLSIAYNYSDLGSTALKPAASNFESVGGAGTYQALDFIYKGKLSKTTKYFVSWFHQNDDRQINDTQNMLRFWVRHSF